MIAKREFRAAHAGDLVAIAAWGDWHASVPKGKVGVVATRGGVRPVYGAPVAEEMFLVDEVRYAAREWFGYVVDPTVDTVWAGAKLSLDPTSR